MDKIIAEVYTLSGPRELYLKKETIDPASVKDDEVIAKTVYSAISPGTEVAAYCGIEPLRADRKVYPRVQGYCNVARIIHKGAAVTDRNVGDYVLSFQSHRTHFVSKSDDFLVEVSPAALKQSVVAYLFHLGLHSTQTADLKIGHNVAVIGFGTLGYTASVFSKLGGANVFALTNQRAYHGASNDGSTVILPKERESVPLIDGRTGGVGVDIVLNTSNRWEDWRLALQCVNKGGTIVNVGFPGRGEAPPTFNPLDPQYLYMKNVTIKYLSSMNVKGVASDVQRFNRERNLRNILAMIENSTLDAEQIISAEIQYTELEDQYKLYEAREKNLFSTLIKW